MPVLGFVSLEEDRDLLKGLKNYLETQFCLFENFSSSHCEKGML